MKLPILAGEKGLLSKLCESSMMQSDVGVLVCESRKASIQEQLGNQTEWYYSLPGELNAEVGMLFFPYVENYYDLIWSTAYSRGHLRKLVNTLEEYQRMFSRLTSGGSRFPMLDTLSLLPLERDLI